MANEGIIVKDQGSVRSEVMAVGQFATATKTVQAASVALADRGETELKEKLDALMSMLNEHGSRLPDPEVAGQLVERVAGELSKPAPDKLTLTSFLKMLGEQAKAVGEIAGAAMALSHLVSRFL